MSDELRDELKRLFGHDDFRTGQREIVEAAVEGRDTLAILPTGGGKSVTYQLPAMLVPGATLILSPLIALMKDQFENLPPAVAERATIINSSLDTSEVGKRISQVKSGQIKIVYAAPERLRQPPFLHALRRANVSLVVVDEAHCISQWGHDFRPDYRAVGQAVQALNPRSVLAVTATATPDVADDIERQLGRPLHRIVRPTYRNNLHLSCRKVSGEDEKLWATLEACRETEGVGLVYAGSREKCEQLSRMLKRYGVEAGFYHAGLPPEERAAAQDRFMSGDVRVMAATVAFGMGVDKSNIRFLIHYNPSRTLENYYQEVGRAGRDGNLSHGILMYSTSDAASVTRRLNEDALNLDKVKAVYNAVRSAVGKRRVGPVAFDVLTESVGGDEGLVRSTLPLLEEVGLIARHPDLPRRLSLYPEYMDDPEREDDPDANAFMAACKEGGDPQAIASATGLSLPELEETILRYQDAGYLSYRASARDLLLEILPPPPDAKTLMEDALERRLSGARQKADAMLAYARDNKCRHGMVARYFGDRWPHLNCGACDVCCGTVSPGGGRGSRSTASVSAGNQDASKNPPHDALVLVHDLTSGYSPFALGKSGVVRALRGTPDAPIKPGRSRSFGALSEYRKADVERLVDALVDQGYLSRDEEDEYRRLYLTSVGREAVQGGDIDIEWRKPVAEPTPKPSKGEPLPDEVDAVLFETLRVWRRGVAAEENVAPFVVFADKVLMGLAAAKPNNEFGLQKIPGIGPAKAAKYGELVLEIIRKHERDN